jgi:hypothetical protein
MRKLMTCLLMLTLLIPCLAQDKSAPIVDCETEDFTGSFTRRIFGRCSADPEIILTINFKRTIERCSTEGGGFTSRMHIRVHGKGVGTTTGNKYVLNSQTKELIVAAPACELSATQTSRQTLISKGPLPNVKLLMTHTVTVDSNCESNVTESTEIICQD